jgi:hypothetical protein
MRVQRGFLGSNPLHEEQESLRYKKSHKETEFQDPVYTPVE